jgi:lambda repressor-like predicted transcriptional regulator
MRKSKVTTRITDLDVKSYLATARKEPRLNTREQELIQLHKQGASLVFLQRKSGYHPSQLFTLLNIDRNTVEGAASYAEVEKVWMHYTRLIIERDEE